MNASPSIKQSWSSFSGRTYFGKDARSENPKASGDREFWIPLVSLVSGLISSEIIQLGPDTVVPHPDHPEIICFEVSNAGGDRSRSIRGSAMCRCEMSC